MKNFAVSTDSNCDLYANEIKDLGIYVGHLSYTIQKNKQLDEYLDEFTKNQQYIDFFNELKNGAIARTSILSLQAHVDMFTKMAEDGVKTALHISQSAGLSPTIDNANKAIEIVKETYPDIDYRAIESSTTTCAEGMLVKLACRLRDEGKSRDEVYATVTDKTNILSIILSTSHVVIRYIKNLVSNITLVYCHIHSNSVLKELSLETYFPSFNVFWTKGSADELLVSWNFIQIYESGIYNAAFIAVRIIAMIIGTSIFLTYTTTPIQLTDAIEQLLAPLKLIKVPVHEFAMMMTIALRFIPTIVEETDKIMSAQKARGADFSNGSIGKRAKALIPVLIPLFISAFRRAGELATAMTCRCYRGGKSIRVSS